MLAELEADIAHRIRQVVPSQVARVRTFSEAMPSSGNDIADLLGTITVGYSGSSYQNNQPPFTRLLKFVVTVILKNLRTHVQPLNVLELISGGLIDYTPSGACGMYFPSGLTPVSDDFVKLTDSTQFVWELVYTLQTGSNINDSCCTNPSTAFRDDYIGFYMFEPPIPGPILIVQRAYRFFNLKTGTQINIAEPDSSISELTLNTTTGAMEGLDPLRPYAI